LEIGRYISVFLVCMFSFSKMGMPAAVYAFDYNYIQCILTSCAGAIFSTIIFVYLSDGIIKWWNKFKEKWFSKKSEKKHFTKLNRRIVKIKNRFGLIGIAALTPILLSMPLGAFLAERFYKDKRKVIIYISISCVFWSNALYFIFLLAYKGYKAI
jgi:hypothetical protein